MLFEHVEMKSGVLNHWKNCYVFAAEVDPEFGYFNFEGKVGITIWRDMMVPKIDLCIKVETYAERKQQGPECLVHIQLHTNTISEEKSLKNSENSRF